MIKNKKAKCKTSESKFRPRFVFYARLRFKKFIIICTRPLTGYLPAVFVRVYLIFTAFTDEKLL